MRDAHVAAKLLPVVVCTLAGQLVLSFVLSEYCQYRHQKAYRVHLKVVFHPTASPDIGEITNQENSQLYLFP